jgi:hypothetical protein
MLDDFAIWKDGQVDSAISRSLGWSGAGLVDTDWERPWLAATRPSDYFFQRGSGPTPDQVFWRKGAYGAATLRVASQAAAEVHKLDAVQFEKAKRRDNVLPPEATNHESDLAYGSSYIATVERTDTQNYSGTYSLKVTVLADGADAFYVPLPETGMARCVAGTSVRGFARVLPDDLANEFAVEIVFYDADFEPIGGSTASYSACASVLWTSFEHTDTAPANTQWVAVRVNASDATTTNGDTYYVDDCRIRFDLDPEPTEYDDARKVYVNLRGDSINYVRNAIPSTAYMSGVKGYLGGVIGAAVVDASPTINLYGDALRCQNDDPASTFGWIASPPGSADAGSGLIHGLRPGVQYVASVWTYEENVGDDLTLIINHDDTYTSLTRGQVLAQYPFDENFVTTDDTNNVWVRLWVTFTMPATGGLTMGSTVQWSMQANVTTPSTGQYFYASGLMLHEGSWPREFFDASMYSSEEPDYLWEESTIGVSPTVGWARSHLYVGRRAKVARVEEIVQKSVGMGIESEVRFAQPPSQKRILRDVYGRPL